MFSIGLTGGIGSGKTTVANRFAEHGVTVIDTDHIAHTLTAAGGAAIPLIAECFGQAFIAPEGSLDRAKMRAFAFSDKRAQRHLEAILHPLIDIECARVAQAAHSEYQLFVVPLLVESRGWKTRVDRVLVVDCSQPLQIKRIMQRNGASRKQALAIIACQASRRARRAQADDVIDNDVNMTLEHLYEAVDKLHKCYLEFAHANRLRWP